MIRDDITGLCWLGVLSQALRRSLAVSVLGTSRSVRMEYLHKGWVKGGYAGSTNLPTELRILRNKVPSKLDRRWAGRLGSVLWPLRGREGVRIGKRIRGADAKTSQCQQPQQQQQARSHARRTAAALPD